jgi:peptidase C25-like protein
MGLARPRLVVVLACAAALALLGASTDALAAKKPTAKSSLKALVRQTAKLPAGAAPKAKRRALERLAVHARKSARRRPCASVHDLNAFRRVLGSVRVRKSKRSRAAHRLTALGPASLNSSRLLLASKKTRRCGGGAKARRGDNPKTKVLSSDERKLHVKIQLPEVGFAPRQAAGKAWTQLVLPNSDAPGKPGTPGIPVVSDVLAVPDGATIKVQVNDVNKVALDGVDVFPAQPDPVDQDTEPPNFLAGPFADLPFEINKKAYASDHPFPAKPADADLLGQARDINIGALQIPTAQYNADKKKLSLITSLDVTLKFAGGSHTFSDQLADPWEQFQRRLAQTFLNSDLLRKIDIREIVRRCGEEMLVITNPATLTAASSFASARSAAGIRTRVVQTGTGSGFIGTTPAEIQSYIRGELTRFLCIHPSYVTIMGDDDLVPTFAGINGIPSDLQYSMKDDVDELPDLAVGRIIGNDQAAIQTAVNKIVAYENSTPNGTWLHHATVAAQFQDDDNNGTENRTFVQFAETVRNGLVGHGETVNRVYGEYPGNNPQKFNDGTDLPAELKKPTFAWNGTGADVTAAWNEGRFLMVHRDHGFSDGWGTPGYSTTNVDALTNGPLLPVLLSINCSSAAYDYDETSFVGQALVNPNGGAVGAFGDTRDSPTWHNTQIALGFADGLLPFILPSEGPALRQRTGNALINGKLRLAGLAPPSGPGITGGDGSTRNELYLWHYFGDPTMQMWGARDPRVFNPDQFSAVFQKTVQGPPSDPPPYWVIVQLPAGLNGETVSLLRNGEVIGKAVVSGDSARIPAYLADGSKPSGQLQVSLEPDASPPVTIEVQNEDPRAQTSITGDCSGGAGTNDPMFMSGTLSGAPLGSTVTVTYEHPSTETVHQETATTDSQGNYQTSYVGDMAGDWFITARYAGTDQYEPAQTAPCNINSG